MNKHLNIKVPLNFKKISNSKIHFKISDVFSEIVNGDKDFFKESIKPLYMYLNKEDYELIKKEEPLVTSTPYGVKLAFFYKVDNTLPQGEQYIKLH